MYASHKQSYIMDEEKRVKMTARSLCLIDDLQKKKTITTNLSYMKTEYAYKMGLDCNGIQPNEI